MDLTTTYLGLELANPLLPAASPLSESLDTIRRLEDAGAPAIVMHSLFEEQIRAAEGRLDGFAASDLSAGDGSYRLPEELAAVPEQYLERIRLAKRAVDIPVIASINGVSSGPWIDYARLMEQAGADALELNLYYLATDPWLSGADVERMHLEVVRDVRSAVDIPLGVKIGPSFSAIAHMARQLVDAGADALVLFNRFLQPDIDLDELAVRPGIALSTSDELRLPLRWIAILYGRVEADLAITTGVHTPEDVVKGLMAGAAVTMLASTLLRHGVSRLARLRDGLEAWMEERGFESVDEMRGLMSQRQVADPAAFERAHYMKVLQAWRPHPAGELRNLRLP